jgi:6-phosphogluconolactonase
MIKVFKTDAELLNATAGLIIEKAGKAIEERGRFALVLSGGRTPDALYKMLAQPEWIDKIPWTKTDIFFGDERYVPEDDKRNNAFVAITLLLGKVPIPRQQIHRIPVQTNPEEDAKAYALSISRYFGSEPKKFDLIFLGLGENGHTASLFPYTDVLDGQTEMVKEVWVEEVGMHRITLTAPMINASHNIVFLVQGESKAEVVNDIINGMPQSDKLPAQLIRPVDGELYWFLDSGSAAKLPHHQVS